MNMYFICHKHEVSSLKKRHMMIFFYAYFNLFLWNFYQFEIPIRFFYQLKNLYYLKHCAKNSFCWIFINFIAFLMIVNFDKNLINCLSLNQETNNKIVLKKTLIKLCLSYVLPIGVQSDLAISNTKRPQILLSGLKIKI